MLAMTGSPTTHPGTYHSGFTGTRCTPRLMRALEGEPLQDKPIQCTPFQSFRSWLEPIGLLLATMVLAPTAPVQAQTPEAVLQIKPEDFWPISAARVSLEVAPDLRTVTGRFVYPIVNDSDTPLRRVRLVRLGQRLAQKPAALNDINHRWIYPDRFDPGSVTVEAAALGPGLMDAQVARLAWTSTNLLPSFMTGADAREAPIAAGPAGVWGGQFRPIRISQVRDVGAELGLGNRSAPSPEMDWSVPSEADASREADANPDPRKPYPRLELVFQEPLPPGTRGLLVGRFKASIPRRFGTWGTYQGQLSLEDCGLPLLEAPGQPGTLAELTWFVDVQRSAELPTWISGRYYDGQPIRFVGQVPSLRLGRELVQDRFQSGTLPPVAFGWMKSARPWHRRLLEETMRQAMAALEAQNPSLVSPDNAPVVFLQTPMRESLAYPVAGTVFFSDHLYRVSSLFKPLHSLEMRYRLYQQLLLRRIEAREGPNAGWLADGLAFWLAEHLQTSEERESGIEHTLGWLTVIPIIDRLLHNPNYPFGNAYARTRYRPDTFGQHLTSLLKPTPVGPVTLHRLSLLAGEDAFHSLVNAYLAPGERGTFAQVVAREMPSLSGTLERWSVPFQPPDYTVTGFHTRAIKGEGPAHYETHAMVTRAGSSPVEPLTVRLESRPRLHWPDKESPSAVNNDATAPKERSGLPARRPDIQDARVMFMSPMRLPTPESPLGSGGAMPSVVPESQSLALVLDTPFKPIRLSLDPDGQLDEALRTNNETPPRYNWLIWDLLFSTNSSSQNVETIDCTACEVLPDRFVSFLLNLRYKDTLLERNVWEFEASRQVESLGLALGYAQYFGQKRTVYRWEHELSARLEFRQMRQQFEVESLTGNFSTGGTAVTLRGGYSYENRLNPYTPIRGVAMDLKGQVGRGTDGTSISTASGTTATSSGQTFGAITADLRGITPFSEVHTLATRLKVESFLWGDRVPVMNGFLLGGYGELRALAPRAEVGQSKLLFSLEDRHPLWLDLDLNLLLFRVREARGVAFLDLGTVGGRGFSGMSSERLRAGLGYGFRFNIDLFGLSPLLCAVDVTVPVDAAIRAGGLPDLSQTRVLIGSYQGF